LATDENSEMKSFALRFLLAGYTWVFLMRQQGVKDFELETKNNSPKQTKE